jgi:hypothetical protein
MTEFPVRHCEGRYIQVISCITLQFIVSMTAQGTDIDMVRKTQTVNASACEFMELILKSV